MFRKRLKEISWKYAIGEIVLIFIGITIAVWFNNWNEHQKSKKIEVKSLVEIKNAIGQDLLDIEENIFGFSKRVHLFKQLIRHIENELPLNDSLRINLPYLQGITTFLSNTGPYETLKSRGLETISNDSIRLKISLYYDFEFEKIQTNEKQHSDHYLNYLKPAMIEQFDLSDYKLEPLNFKKLIKNFEFKQTIYWALRTDNYMLELYLDLENKAKTLVEELNKEVKRLN